MNFTVDPAGDIQRPFRWDLASLIITCSNPRSPTLCPAGVASLERLWSHLTKGTELPVSRNGQTERQRDNRSCAGSWEVAEGVGSSRTLNLLTAKAQNHRRVEVETHMSANLQLSEHSSVFSETHSSKISKLPYTHSVIHALTGGFSLKLHGASEGRKVWREWKQIYLPSLWKPR